MPEQIIEKTCTRCRKSKLADSEHFPKGRKGHEFDPWCRECYRQKTNLYNAEHPRGKTPDQKLIEQRAREVRESEAAEAKERKAEIARRMKLTAPARQKENARKHNNLLKREAMEHYGGAFCRCCGEDTLIMLALDHVENDGAAHRKSLTGESHRMPTVSYVWAKRNNWPPIFQVTCFNCNWARHWNGGICPHQSAVTDLWNTFIESLKLAA